MKKELSFLNKSFGLFVQVALGKMDGKNIKMIDYGQKSSERILSYPASLCRRQDDRNKKKNQQQTTTE